MAKLPVVILQSIFDLLQDLSELVDDATNAEYLLFERFGETEETINSLDELKSVALESASRYSQLANLRLRLAENQPKLSKEMLALLEKTINQNQQRIPAMKRSIEEIKIEGGLS